jgi:hypothetical protein
LDVVDSVKPENLEEYRYYDGAPAGGTAAGPHPERWNYASREQARLGHLIDWDTVSAEAEKSIPTLVRTALERTQLEGGSVEWVDIAWFPNDDAPTIRVHLKGLRQDGLLVADTKGRVLSVKVTD